MRSGKPNEGSLFWSVYTVRMYIFRIFMYNFLSNPCSILCTVSHTFFCVYIHFRDVYIHFVKKCAVSYLSEKNAGCEVRQRFAVSRNAACVRERTNVQSYVQIRMYIRMYKSKLKIHSYVQKSLLVYTFFTEPYVQSNIQSGGTPKTTFFGDNTNKNISNTPKCTKYHAFRGSRIALVKSTGFVGTKA